MSINEAFSTYDFDITDLRTFQSYRDENPLDLASLWYGDLHNARPCDLTDTEPVVDLFYVPRLASGSDYSGGSITVANHKFLLEEFGENPHVHEVYDGYGTYAIAFNISQISDPELAEYLIECFEALDDYPVLDDDLLGQVEQEAQEEAWVSWLGRWDFPRALPDAINTHLDHQANITSVMALAFYDLGVKGAPVLNTMRALRDCVPSARVESVEGDDSFDSPLFALFWELQEKTNTYWENEQGNTATIDLERLCDARYILESEHWQALVKSGAVEYKEEN